MLRHIRIVLALAALLFSTTAWAQASLQQGVPLWSLRTPDTLKLDSTLAWIQPYPRPLEYNMWMLEIAKCEGIKLPVDGQWEALKFYAVNARDFQINSDTTHSFIGFADFREGRIIIALPFIGDKKTVSHEILHFLMGWADPKYYGQHGREYLSCGLL